jgi:ATP-binding cassette subfamily F protein 3
VLADVTLEVGSSERVGLIGRNGSGKSTLLQIVANDLQPDEGQVSIQKGTRIGYLPQIPVDMDLSTVYQVLALGYQDVLACRSRLAELEVRMSAQNPPADDRQLAGLLKQYAEQQEWFQRAGGYEMDARIQSVANGLRIPPEQFERPYATLSGGEKTKVGLASLLIARPTLLLLDEPTNHLDTKGIEWLETFLATHDGACLIVSHDRYFLDRVVTKVIELEDGEAYAYTTNYTDYLREKEDRLLQQFADHKEQQKKIKQMKVTINQLQEWGRVGGNEKFFRRAASMEKALDRMEMLKRPVMERRATEFELQPAERSGREVLTITGLTKQYGDRLLLNKVDGMLRYGDKVVLVGDNGAGKSTFFKLLLGEEQPDEGRVGLGARVEIGYLAQQDRPDSRKTVLQTFCEEAKVEVGEGRTQLARYLFYGSDVFKSLNLLSGGEWTRLRLALLMYKKPNFLLLDEPTNHLDIASREALEEALEEFPGTLVAISHDRYFINRIASRIWELHDGKLTGYLGNYDAFKEKREQLRPVAAPDVAVRAKQPAEGRARSGVSTERASVQIEHAIAEAEQRLVELDAGLAAAQEDFATLSERWVERERVQEQLSRLYEQWVELE